MRPRCREFLPLATQQMRLRNLVRIHGHIQGRDDDLDALTYYSLHSSDLGEAFYMSEHVKLRHTQQKWAEIQQSQQMQKSNANCVCVKVWKRASKAETIKEQQTDDRETLKELTKPKEPISALTKELSNTSLSPHSLLRPPDKLLFSWGVYFSGLVLLGENMKCTPNSLIFQINENFFVSPEHIQLECPTEDWETRQQQQQQHHPRYSASVPQFSKPSAERTDYSPLTSHGGGRSLKPPASDALKEDPLKASMKRFTQCLCDRTDVRKSYDLNRLLRLQERQRNQLQYRQESEEFTQEIKRLSLHCITEDQLMTRRRTKSSHTNSTHLGSMGRTLSVLLAEQQEIDPHTLYRAKKLRQEIETVRSRHRLLEKEFNTYSTRIAEMRRRLTALELSRQQGQQALQLRNDQLQLDNARLDELLQETMRLQMTKRTTMQNVEIRMSALCMELREIYPIKLNSAGLYTVCNIPFPNVDNSFNPDHVSPIALSALLGYIAHLVQMMAVIINRPLRNPIIYEGSKTRILDIVRDLPMGTREFPLYTRSSIPSKTMKHAVYLLNQNISQIYYDISGNRCQFRATIENILSIFGVLSDIEQNARDLHGRHSQTHPSHRLRLVSSSVHHKQSNDPHNKGRERTESSSKGSDCTDFSATHHRQNDSSDCLSKSHSSVDMHHEVLLLPDCSGATKSMTYLQMPMAPGTISQPMSIGVRGGMGQRICRSVGSYSDSEDDLKDGFEHVYSNSDSNIQFQRDRI